MSTSKHGITEKEKVSEIISDWVGKNKKTFWKYEVSCFYKTYTLRISNLPEPSVKDIHLSANNRLLGDKQKKQLCDALKKARSGLKVFTESSVNVQIDYDDGAVITKIV